MRSEIKIYFMRFCTIFQYQDNLQGKTYMKSFCTICQDENNLRLRRLPINGQESSRKGIRMEALYYLLGSKQSSGIYYLTFHLL